MNKIQDAIVTSYTWPGMRKEVRRVVKECKCMAGRGIITRVAPLRPTPMPMYPFELVGLDLVTLTRSVAGNRYLIVAQDYMSPWPEVMAV